MDSHRGLLTTLRAARRLILLSLVTAFSFLVVTLGRITLRGPRRRRWIQRWYRRWCLGMCRVLGVRVEARGKPPEMPFLLVTNHLSYVDVFVLGGLTGSIFIAKSEIDTWPVAGMLTRSVDTLYVDRTSRRDVVRVARGITDAMAENQGLCLFAESTTSSGHTVEPFKSPLLAPAAAADLDVHYAAVSYRTPEGSPPAHLAVCWWGDMELLAHLLALVRLPAIYATVSFGREPIRDADRKRLASALHRAVLDCFTPSASPAATATPDPRGEPAPSHASRI